MIETNKEVEDMVLEDKELEKIEYNMLMELLKVDWVFVEHYYCDREYAKESGMNSIVSRVCYKYFVFTLISGKDLGTGEITWAIADSYLHTKGCVIATCVNYKDVLGAFAIIKEEIIKIMEKVDKNNEYGCGNLYEKLKETIIKRLEKERV